MERCANTEALNAHEDKLAKDERQQEFFEDDTEELFNEIETNLMRIYSIEDDYELDFTQAIKDRIIDMLKR